MGACLFTKFDPRAFLESEKRGHTPAKLAKTAKLTNAESERGATLATFAALAGGLSQSHNREHAPESRTHAGHDAGAPRAWAEGLARLDPAHPPSDVPPGRWVRFIDDCGMFLDGGWAAKAAALGWGPSTSLAVIAYVLSPGSIALDCSGSSGTGNWSR
jgi:hypothetical protein